MHLFCLNPSTPYYADLTRGCLGTIMVYCSRCSTVLNCMSLERGESSYFWAIVATKKQKQYLLFKLNYGGGGGPPLQWGCPYIASVKCSFLSRILGKATFLDAYSVQAVKGVPAASLQCCGGCSRSS